MSKHPTPAFYAVIPADVRYDSRLKPMARLLYGEITALCSASGYCWAPNDWFAELYDVAPETVSRWISQLSEFGYIHLTFHHDETGTERRIFLEKRIAESLPPLTKRSRPPLTERSRPPLDKKIKPSYKESNMLMEEEKSHHHQQEEDPKRFVPSSGIFPLPDPITDPDKQINEWENKIVGHLEKSSDIEKHRWARHMQIATDKDLWEMDLTPQFYQYAAKTIEFGIGKIGIDNFRKQVDNWPGTLWRINFFRIWVANYSPEKAKNH